MAVFGIFSELTFVDGTSPPISAANLNEIERVVKLCDTELNRSAAIKFFKYKQYFYLRNTNVLLLFSDYTDWTNHYPSQNDLSDESSNQLMNETALSMENLLATAGWMSISQTLSSTVDLSVFYDGGASGTTDLIIIMFYVSDAAGFSDLEFRFGDDFSNCYFLDASSSFQTGWNCLFPAKTDFSTVGSPTGWDTIDYVRIAPYAAAGYAGEYMYFQYIGLARQDPLYSGFSNVFQEYMGSVSGWENVFQIDLDVVYMYYDQSYTVEKLGLMSLNVGIQPNVLHIYCSVVSFISKFEFYCKIAGYSASVTWYRDSNNYAEVYISSNTFYMVINEAGTPASVSIALTNNLLKNERFYIYFEKDYQTLRAILMKQGEEIKVLEYETSISSSDDGCVYIGKPSVYGYSFLTDFEIGNKAIKYLTQETFESMVYSSTQYNLTSNSLVNIGDTLRRFSPFQTYKVEAYICAFNSGSTTPDVKIAWTSSNLTNVTSRYCEGPATATTTVGATTVKRSYYGMSTQVSYGCDGTTNESYIKETFYVRAGKLGGTLQLQAGQVTTDAGNPTTMWFNTIAITPVNRSIPGV